MNLRNPVIGHLNPNLAARSIVRHVGVKSHRRPVHPATRISRVQQHQVRINPVAVNIIAPIGVSARSRGGAGRRVGQIGRVIAGVGISRGACHGARRGVRRPQVPLVVPVIVATHRAEAGAHAGQVGAFLIAENAQRADDNHQQQEKDDREDEGRLDRVGATPFSDFRLKSHSLISTNRLRFRVRQTPSSVSPAPCACTPSAAASSSSELQPRQWETWTPWKTGRSR